MKLEGLVSISKPLNRRALLLQTALFSDRAQETRSWSPSELSASTSVCA